MVGAVEVDGCGIMFDGLGKVFGDKGFVAHGFELKKIVIVGMLIWHNSFHVISGSVCVRERISISLV